MRVKGYLVNLIFLDEIMLMRALIPSSRLFGGGECNIPLFARDIVVNKGNLRNNDQSLASNWMVKSKDFKVVRPSNALV